MFGKRDTLHDETAITEALPVAEKAEEQPIAKVTKLEAGNRRKDGKKDAKAAADGKPADILPFAQRAKQNGSDTSNKVAEIKPKLLPVLMEHLELDRIVQIERADLEQEIAPLVSDLLGEFGVTLNTAEQKQLCHELVNDMVGLGPLEALLADEAVTDILVNGPRQIYVERNGILEMTDVKFDNDEQVAQIANRIVAKVGRRVDQSSPMCDARLEDGSRVNVILPPLSLKGPAISIRKFAKKPIDFDRMVEQGNLSAEMAAFLKLTGRLRLNVLVSGGTGSGKTTMLNAVSQTIDQDHRIVTIEDAAELQLQQPHVLTLETRPANMEGKGQIDTYDLVRNALRMRPDRLIIGEVRGTEAGDMLQAMNTGHEGSMGTIHANGPREALTRLENMVVQANPTLPTHAIRTQIVQAIDLVIQTCRYRDGKRRVVSITEVVGMEGDIIQTQDLFRFVPHGETEEGEVKGEFENAGIRPKCAEKAREYGLEDELAKVLFQSGE